MFKAPEQFRVTKGDPRTISTIEDGNNGVFIIKAQGLHYVCIASDGYEWEHVSVSILKKNMVTIKRTPTWEEMCMIKDIFWDDEDVVIQYHLAKKDYVNMHPYVLHLWKKINYDIPTPPSIMVGLK